MYFSLFRWAPCLVNNIFTDLSRCIVRNNVEFYALERLRI